MAERDSKGLALDGDTRTVIQKDRGDRPANLSMGGLTDM